MKFSGKKKKYTGDDGSQSLIGGVVLYVLEKKKK